MFAIEDTVLFDLARQLPSAAALLVVVWYFLRHIQQEAARRGKMDERRSDALREIGTTCHTFQNEIARRQEAMTGRLTDVLDRNSDALTRAIAALERTEYILDEHVSRASGSGQRRKQPPTDP